MADISGQADDNSSSGISAAASENWWHTAPPKKSRTSQGAKNKLSHTALHGKRCLLTGETGPSSAMERCHLVDRATTDKQRCQLQYAWGRKFDIDNRWNLFYLRSDLHKAFDSHLGTNGTTNAGWALVPEESLVEEIALKIENEQDRRKNEGINGPWPDFRSEGWFPARRDGYKYIFVPLTLKDEGVSIARHEWSEDTPASPITLRLYSPPLYEGFPRLACHVHPYMVIMNAYPKLRDNAMNLPRNIRQMLGDLELIYNTWQKAWQDAASLPFRKPGTTSRGSSQTDSRPRRSSIGQSGLRSELHMTSNEDTADQDATPSGSNSGGQNEYGEIFDTSHESSGSILSVLTSDNSVACQGDTIDPPPTYSFVHAQTNLAEADQTVQMPKDFTEWIQGVEAARERDQLVAVINELPDLGEYAAEKARSPPTDDWHSWTSEYAPWYVLLPKNKDRGLLSSNDWAEVKNHPPLTRALDKDE